MNQSDEQRCLTCNHSEHESGRCKQCNCGENDVVRPKRSFYFLTADYGDHINRIYRNANVVRYEKGAYKLCQ